MSVQMTFTPGNPVFRACTNGGVLLFHVLLAVGYLFHGGANGVRAQEEDPSSPIAEISSAETGELAAESSGETNREVVDTGAGSPDERSYPIFDWLWDVPRLYSNDDNDWIQNFSLFGRYHGQYYNVDASQGSAHGWENRRLWAGARTTFLR